MRHLPSPLSGLETYREEMAMSNRNDKLDSGKKRRWSVTKRKNTPSKKKVLVPVRVRIPRKSQ